MARYNLVTIRVGFRGEPGELRQRIEDANEAIVSRWGDSVLYDMVPVGHSALLVDAGKQFRLFGPPRWTVQAPLGEREGVVGLLRRCGFVPVRFF